MVQLKCTKMTGHTSPVFNLAQAIAGSPFQLVPERAEDLYRQLRGIPLVFEEQNGDFDMRASAERITVSVGALNLLWCASYAYWFFYQAFVQAQKACADHVRLTDKATSDAACLYEWALQCVRAKTVIPWPATAPEPSLNSANDILAAINELFLVTTGWLMLHECGHIILQHPIATRARAQVEEAEADAFATDCVLGDVSDAGVLHKRALGIAVANVVLVAVDLMRGVLNNKLYPPAYERLNRNLRCRQLTNEHPVHAFADVLLQVHLARFQVPHKLNLDDKFDSILDDFCVAMSRQE